MSHTTDLYFEFWSNHVSLGKVYAIKPIVLWEFSVLNLHWFFSDPFSSDELSYRQEMAAKPLTTEAIAVTEKKMDMALDDIIKMSKNTANKARKERRFPNKMQKFPNNATQDRPRKLQRFMDSRSSVRQGALAKRRSNFQGNQFALTTEVARRAVVAPTRPRAFYRRAPNWNKTR
ncbi:hypothetical protein SDJN03_24713, partial [Cucurbita argyrosperma subsp. sororia]